MVINHREVSLLDTDCGVGSRTLAGGASEAGAGVLLCLKLSNTFSSRSTKVSTSCLVIPTAAAAVR